MLEALVVEDLRKSYGAVIAVDGVSLSIQEGEIFGMVGPNGAGKTTTIECIEGLREQDSGRVQVLGMDPQRQGAALRQRIGIQLQESALHPRLKVGEAMDLFSSFYDRALPWEPLLEQMGLDEKRDASVSKLSGGQRQRLHIALSLLNDPELVFFDELTTGLDPQARRAMWDLVRSVRERGKTVFLTTHYMEEAERLCDRVAIMDSGRIVALDTPDRLISAMGGSSRLLAWVDGRLDEDAIRALEPVERVEAEDDHLVIYGRGPRLVSTVVYALESQEVHLRDLRTLQASLEDVFLAMTGREIRQ